MHVFKKITSLVENYLDSISDHKTCLECDFILSIFIFDKVANSLHLLGLAHFNCIHFDLLWYWDAWSIYNNFLDHFRLVEHQGHILLFVVHTHWRGTLPVFLVCFQKVGHVLTLNLVVGLDRFHLIVDHEGLDHTILGQKLVEKIILILKDGDALRILGILPNKGIVGLLLLLKIPLQITNNFFFILNCRLSCLLNGLVLVLNFLVCLIQLLPLLFGILSRLLKFCHENLDAVVLLGVLSLVGLLAVEASEDN